MEAKTQTKKQGEMAYTTIHHKVRKKLDISLEDYCVGDAIYNLANNPKSNIYGWCYSSKKYISDFIQIGERTVFRSIETLIEKGLVEKDADTKYLRATAKWYENVVIEKAKNDYDKLSEGMTNRQSLRQTGRGGMTSRQSTYDKVADNNNSNNKIDNNIEQSSKGDISFVSSNWIEQCCADQREHIRLPTPRIDVKDNSRRLNGGQSTDGLSKVRLGKVRLGKDRDCVSSETQIDTFSLSGYLTKMRESKLPHIRLIGWYFEERGEFFPDKQAIQAEIKRWVRDAQFIAKYSNDQIGATLAYVKQKFPKDWKLSTIRKYISIKA